MSENISLPRRKFLTGLGGGLLVGALPGFTRYAHAAGTYKALVCVYLDGGNDGNNMIVPTDSAGYAKYFAARGDSGAGRGGIGLPRSQLLALPPLGGAAQFGAHPEFTELQQVWNAGDLAVLFNVGNIARPMAKADFTNATLRPDNLFAHPDQRDQWQSAGIRGGQRSGWGGRLADAVAGFNGAAPVPAMISLAGRDLFTVGDSSAALSVQWKSNFEVDTFGGHYAADVDRGLRRLLDADRRNLLVMAAQDTTDAGLGSSAVLNPIRTGASSSIARFFNGQDGALAQQLLQVARMVESRSSLGVSRQVFYVELAGFVTHTRQIDRQALLFAQLSPAFKAFNDAMAQLGMSDQVTTFTMSDFGRTLAPASGSGSDHGWGNHHLVMGGAVRGQRFYGQFPDLSIGGPDDISTKGRWLPTTSVEQYGATLASWFGVLPSDLPKIFPNLSSFATKNLGFMA